MLKVNTTHTHTHTLFNSIGKIGSFEGNLGYNKA